MARLLLNKKQGLTDFLVVIQQARILLSNLRTDSIHPGSNRLHLLPAQPRVAGASAAKHPLSPAGIQSPHRWRRTAAETLATTPTAPKADPIVDPLKTWNPTLPATLRAISSHQSPPFLNDQSHHTR
ncbi:MAG: hypothetical protein ACK5XN_21825 [Bacteroidota bacterium]